MIIGNGLMAKSCKAIDQDDLLFFASGVSNSQEIDDYEFQREEILLRKILLQYPDKQLFYFSTCSIYDPSLTKSKYIKHNIKMENLIINTAKKYLIIRLGNVIGQGGNSNTLFNFIKQKALDKQVIQLYQYAQRLIIDTEDVPRIIKKIIKDGMINQIVNVAYPKYYTPFEIANEISTQMGNLIQSEIHPKGSKYKLTISDIYYPLKIDHTNYLKNIVKKYI